MMLRRAGVFLLALVLGTAAGATVLGVPAMAGGWAVTVIDTAGTIEVGKTHRVSFWVLQHGSHPFSESDPKAIGTVGLTLSDGSSRVTFIGTPLPEPAHYVTTVTVPHAGQWKVSAVQGVFAGFHIGTLTVPGTWQPLGVPAAPSAQDLQKYWPGKVQPPVLAVDRNRDPFVNEGDSEPGTVVAPAPAEAESEVNNADTRAAAVERPDPGTPLLAGGLLVLLVALALGGRWWVRRRVAQT